MNCLGSEIYYRSKKADTLSDFVQKKKFSSIFFLTDQNTKKHCFPFFRKSFGSSAKLIVLQGGEENKNLDLCIQIWNELERFDADRNSVLINLGGGAICDIGGFAASVFKRGMAFVNVPTTLISQADSCIGGKTGINFNHLKNHLGTFKNPEAVFIFPEFLQTLPERELNSGMAEILKHALIADENYWNELGSVSAKDHKKLKKIINRSLEIKSSIVEQDPEEKNVRKLLNFGHTIGHAIETYFLEKNKTVLHGEAVAAGMIAESFISTKLSELPLKSLVEISDRIERSFLLPEISKKDFSSLVQLMRSDKKNSGKGINFTLLKKIGKAEINFTADENLIREALEYYSAVIS